jgi:hypothetical protein
MSKASRNLVREPDALIFDGFVRKWAKLLNLQNWRLERGSKAAKNAMASVEFDMPARLAVYRLGDFGSEAITPRSLEDTAIHELLHVLLLDLILIASGKPTGEELEAAEHAVINVLEKLLKEHA